MLFEATGKRTPSAGKGKGVSRMNNGERQSDIRQTILVVDNLDDFRHTISSWLTRQGYRVIEADSGRQAVEVAERERPDLILMDIKMPGEDGLSAARRLRESAELSKVPIVAVSADATEYYKKAARDVGFSRYLTKPVEPDELREILDDLLPRARAKGAGEIAGPEK